MLSAAQQKEVLREVARMALEELRTGSGGEFSEVVAIPLAAAAAQLSLSVATARRRLPITKAADGKDTVTVANLRRYVALRTTYPQGWPEDLRFSPESSPDPRPPALDPTTGAEHSQSAGGRHSLRAV